MKEAIQTLLTSDKMAHAFEYLKQDEAHTIDQQIELVQISSFSPFEEKRAIRFKELLTEAGLDPVMDEVHNVYAHIHGTGNGPTLYVSAHLDTVFPPETPLPVKREGTKIYSPGIGDDTRGLAEILTLARTIKESGLKPVGDKTVNLVGVFREEVAHAAEVSETFLTDVAADNDISDRF